MARTRAQRLSVVDEMFLRTHRGYGTPVVMQGLWRGGDVTTPDLQGVHDTLSRGPLSRNVIRPRVPGARPRWRSGATPWPVEWSPVPTPRNAVVAWADAVAQRPVDPTTGAGWRIAATRLVGGGTVVSLVCSHVVADARGLAGVLAAAMAGVPTPTPADPVHPLADDAADAARMVALVGARTARAVAGVALHPSRLTELRSAPAPEPRADCAQAVETAVVDLDAASWDAEATRTGGTPNSLLIAVAVAIAARGDAPMQVAVPVDRRDETGSTANSIDMAELTVHPADSPAAVRGLLREAYRRPPMSSPAGFPPELLQLLPDAVAYRLAPDPGERDVLCSNIGTIPVALSALGGARAEAVAARAVHPGIDARQLAASRNRLSAYLCRLGDRYSLALVSKDPGLPERIEAALAAHSLVPHSWDR